MTEAEIIMESSSSEGEEATPKIKKEGTPSWLSTLALGLHKGILSEVNWRRKHPKLGNKIAQIEKRLRSVEKTICNFKLLLSDELKAEYQTRVINQIHKDWKDKILPNL